MIILYFCKKNNSLFIINAKKKINQTKYFFRGIFIMKAVPSDLEKKEINCALIRNNN